MLKAITVIIGWKLINKNDMQNLTGIILAGGKSSRMGKDKSFLTIDGKTFIQRQAEKLQQFCSEIIISTDNDEINIPNTLKVSDIYKNCGPIGGLYAGLKHSTNEFAFVLTVDTPLVSDELISFIVNNSDGFDVTVSAFNEKIHPLIGMYHKSVVSILENEIKNENYKVLKFIEKTSFQILDTSNFLKDNYFNINTLNEYKLINNTPE